MAKTKTKNTYLFHELSSYLPLLEGEDFDALVEDIKQFGQIEPAILYDGKILDGRNRYRACKKLGIELKVREWKPSEATGITPLQFVISENIVRRHLNEAQRSEVGLLLLEEEEKLAKERMSEIGKLGAKMKSEEGKKGFQEINKKEEESALKQKIGELSKGKSVDIVAPKVKIHGTTLQKAKKIKEVAKKDKKIAKDWENAKRGKFGVDRVYKKVKEKEFVKSLEASEPELKKAIEAKKFTTKEAKEVITLPKELKDAVIKPKSKLTIQEAKEVAELPIDIILEIAKDDSKITVEDAKRIAKLPDDVKKEVLKPKSKITIDDAENIIVPIKPELRKDAIKVIEKQAKEQEDTKEYIKEVGTGNYEPPEKVIDLDEKIITQFTNIYKQIKVKMTRRLVDSYAENTRNKLYRIMKECLVHLQTELEIEGEIIDVRKSKR